MFSECIHILQKQPQIDTPMKSDGTIFFFCSAVQGRAFLISIWNSHASQTYNIHLKHIVCGVVSK